MEKLQADYAAQEKVVMNYAVQAFEYIKSTIDKLEKHEKPYTYSFSPLNQSISVLNSIRQSIINNLKERSIPDDMIPDDNAGIKEFEIAIDEYNEILTLMIINFGFAIRSCDEYYDNKLQFYRNRIRMLYKNKNIRDSKDAKGNEDQASQQDGFSALASQEFGEGNAEALREIREAICP